MIDYYVKNLTALGRVSEPEDVAKLVSFQASSDSNFVTGQTQVRSTIFTLYTAEKLTGDAGGGWWYYIYLDGFDHAYHLAGSH